jgi:hypothetical protein
VDTVVDSSTAITALEEIKRLHRTGQWALLPDRYTALRRLLVTLRATRSGLTEAHLTALQAAITNLRELEATVERGLECPVTLKASKFNTIVSRDLDGLVQMLVELKAASGE